MILSQTSLQLWLLASLLTAGNAVKMEELRPSGGAQSTPRRKLQTFSCGSMATPLPAGEMIILEHAPEGQLCRLLRGPDLPLGRSYDGYGWESLVTIGVVRDYVEFVEDNGVTKVFLPPHDTQYYLEGDAYHMDPEEEISRFLRQTTFGPRPHEIEELHQEWNETYGFSSSGIPAQAFEDHIKKQMFEVEPYSHRAFYRSHGDIGEFSAASVYNPCDPYSVWSDHMFTDDDQGSEVWFGETDTPGTVQVVVGDTIRGEMNANDVPGGGATTWRHLDMVDSTEGKVYFKDSTARSEADPVTEVVDNPFIQFRHEPVGQLMMHADQLSFASSGRLQTSVNCTAPLATNVTVLFARDTTTGQYYRFTPTKFRLVENDLDTEHVDYDALATIPYGRKLPTQNFVNRESCKVVPRGDLANLWLRPNATHSIVCGSPGEAGTNPSAVRRFPYWGNFDQPGTQESFLEAANWAPDQLRQRVAFALSQIVVLGTRRMTRPEGRTGFFDIFVRHAFGNYRDIIKETIYHKLMGDYLTYAGSRSIVTSEHANDPDQNFARELMQLFTIGSFKLHDNGTYVTDPETGEPVRTYQEEDVFTNARIFTGFYHAEPRGNAHMSWFVDPMIIKDELHDRHPKMDLNGNFYGDRYPLCVDLPPQDYLRKGAVFEFVGGAFGPGNDRHFDALDISGATSNYSQLHEALCNRDPTTNACRHVPYLVLEDNLACVGGSCAPEVNRVLVDNAIEYQYVRRPCVNLAFYEEGQTAQYWDPVERGIRGFCMEAKGNNAGVSCCDDHEVEAVHQCHGSKANVPFAMAEAHCALQNQVICNDITYDGEDAWWDAACQPVWKPHPCSIGIKIDPKGRIAPIHDTQMWWESPEVREDTLNRYRVKWIHDADNATGTGQVPNVATDDCGPSCYVHGESCICSTVNIEERVVFSFTPTRDEVLSKLHIGSVPPDIFDEGTYMQAPGTPTADGVTTYWTPNSEGMSLFNKDTIFHVKDEQGKDVYLRNMESFVWIPGTAMGFRNAPSFLDLNTRDNVRGAHLEVDAFLDKLMVNSNMAPFISYRLIQRLVTSNPSGRYMRSVSNAFRTGKYGDFGSGQNGDLAATVAAILLDQEARSVVVDVDPIYGQLREPLLKIIHINRLLKHRSDWREFDELHGIEEQIWQDVHLSRSVFGHFSADYVPGTELAAGMNLAVPEAEIIFTPTVISYMNRVANRLEYCCGQDDDGWTDFGDDLILAMTTRKKENLTNSTKSGIFNALLTTTAGKHHDKKKFAWKILALSPEFQATGYHRPRTPQPKSSSFSRVLREHKAVIYLFNSGGADSTNSLLPAESCATEYQAYRDKRNPCSFEGHQLLSIDANSNQTCSEYGMRPHFEKIHEMYQAGDALWMANVGLLHEPYGDENMTSVTWPAGLGSHPSSTRETHMVNSRALDRSGVMGRLADTLSSGSGGYTTAAYAFSGKRMITNHDKRKSTPVLYGGSTGRLGRIRTAPFYESLEDDAGGRALLDGLIMNLSQPSTNVFANRWSNELKEAVGKPIEYDEMLDAVPLKGNYDDFTDLTATYRDLLQLGQNLGRLAEASAQNGVERTTMTFGIGNFDTHGICDAAGFDETDFIMEVLERELKAQGRWDTTVIMQASEFGRTSNSNGRGTDHGWGGNYFVAGGSVDGGKILGEYPRFGQRRPTTPWDSPWNAIAQWMGVEDDDELDLVLPNRWPWRLLQKEDLFREQ